jgi:hypothetical protein
MRIWETNSFPFFADFEIFQSNSQQTETRQKETGCLTRRESKEKISLEDLFTTLIALIL